MINSNRFYLIMWLLVLGLAGGWIAKNIKVNSDLGQFLPEEDSLHNRLLKKVIASSPSTGILILSLEGDRPEELAKLNKELAKLLRVKSRQKNSRIEEVLNGEFRFNKAHKDFLLKNHWLLNPKLSIGTFSSQHIRAKLEEVLEELRSPAPLLDKSVFVQDPVGSTKEVLDSWTNQVRPTKFQGVWFSKNKKQSLIFIQSKAAGVDINYSQILIKNIKSDFLKLHTSNHNVKLVMSGFGYYAVIIREKIREDIIKLSIAAGLFVCFLLLFIYRGFAPLFYGVLPLVSAMLAGIIVVMAVFGHIYGIAMAFGITLVGVTIDYPIHFFTHIKKSGSAKASIIEIWPTLRLGVVTTTLGFTAMLLAGFEGLKQLATFAIVGLLVAACITRWVLPSVIPAKVKFEMPEYLLEYSERTIHFLGKLRWLVAIVTVAALAWLLMQGPLTDHDVKKLTPLSVEQKTTDKKLRNIIGTLNTRYVVVVNGDSVEQVLQRSEALMPELNKLVESKVAAGYDMAARYLPSLRTQMARQSLIPDKSLIETQFKLALSGLPFKYESFKPFIDSIVAAKKAKPITYADASKSPLRWKVQTLLQQHKTGWMALVLLRRVTDTQAVIDWAKTKHVKGMEFLDTLAESSNAMKTYVDEAINLLAWGSSLILIILAVALRSVKKMLKVVLPIASALIITVCFWIVSGVKLNSFHLISLLLVVGIGIDYALFFIRKTTSDDHRLDFLAVWICNVTTVVVFGLLFFSFPLVLQAVGGTVAVGALVAFIASASVAEKIKSD